MFVGSSFIAATLDSLVTRDDECEIVSAPPLKKAKSAASGRSKPTRPLVESLYLNCMVSTYNQFFASYSINWKNMSQLIPCLVWKNVYEHYCKQFPNSQLKKETLKDKLRETLKELKIGTSNEENSKREILQNPEVLIQLQSTNGHAMRNVIKKVNLSLIHVVLE